MIFTYYTSHFFWLVYSLISSLYPLTWSDLFIILSSLVIHQFTVCSTNLTLQHHASNFPTFPGPPLQHTSNHMPSAYTFLMLSTCFHLSCTFFLVFMLVTSSVGPPPYLYAFAYSCSPLFYAYLIIHAGHFIQAFAHFTLITPVMPLGLTLFMLLLQSYLSLYFSSVLSSSYQALMLFSWFTLFMLWRISLIWFLLIILSLYLLLFHAYTLLIFTACSCLPYLQCLHTCQVIPTFSLFMLIN